MNKRKESYKKCINQFGLITLCYLISYYEHLEQFEECGIILESIKEYCQFNNIKNYPTRYNRQSIIYFCKELDIKPSLITSNVTFDIKNYASKVVEFVDKETT